MILVSKEAHIFQSAEKFTGKLFLNSIFVISFTVQVMEFVFKKMSLGTSGREMRRNEREIKIGSTEKKLGKY